MSQSEDFPPNPTDAARHGDDYVPFAARFRSWWEGVEPGAIARDGHADKTAPEGQSESVRRNRLIVVDRPLAAVGDARHGSEMRYRLWSRLYGEGFSLPGGQESTTRLLKQAELRKGQSVLDLAAGLGGTARAAAQLFGATVMGLEPDPDVAALGMQLSAIRGLEARVPISAYDPETVTLSDRAYDIIIMRERLSLMPSRDAILALMEKALSDGGKVVLSDLMTARAALRDSPDIEPVCGEAEIQPWTLGDFQETCSENGLQIVNFRDETDGYRRLLRDSWTDFSNNMTQDALDREFVDVLMGEAESVKRRIAAINAGALRFGYTELCRTGG